MKTPKERYQFIVDVIKESQENWVTLQFISEETGIKYMTMYNFLHWSRKWFNKKTMDKIEKLEKYFLKQ